MILPEFVPSINALPTEAILGILTLIGVVIVAYGFQDFVGTRAAGQLEVEKWRIESLRAEAELERAKNMVAKNSE